MLLSARLVLSLLAVLLCSAAGWCADRVAWQLPHERPLRRAESRPQRIAVDSSVLFRAATAADSTFQVPLGAGETRLAVVERTRVDGPGRFVSFGRFVDAPGSDFLCIVDNGRVAGVFAPHPDRRFLVLPTEEPGFHRLTLTPSGNDLPGTGVRPPIASADIETAPQARPGGAANMLAPPTVIDVLILYTSKAKQLAGGQPGIEFLAQLAIEQANDAYTQSGVLQQLRLAHVAEISYFESGSAALDLEYLTRPADGIMDEAITLRQDYRADLVHLLVGFADQSDLGWLNNFNSFNATWTFSVSTAIYLPNDVFTRAIGRNQGIDHDWVTPQTGVFAFSYGYSFTGQSQQRFSTIMSNGPGRIRRHSNPTILFDGVPMGQPLVSAQPASAADSLNLTAATIAAISDNVVVPPPVISSAVTASAIVDRYFEYQITATNGPTSFGAAGLPLGVLVNTQSGLISGTPRQAGVYRIDLSAGNPGGTGVKVLTLTVDQPDDCPLQRMARRLDGLAIPKSLSPLKPFTLGTTESDAIGADLLTASRRFRDEVLKVTPEGRQLIAHYYQHGPDWFQTVQRQPRLFQEGAACLLELLPVLREHPFGEQLVVTPGLRRRMELLLTALEQESTPEQRAALRDVSVWLTRHTKAVNAIP